MNKSSSKTIKIEGATDICTALHHNVFGLMISSQHTLAQSTSGPSTRRQLSSWPPVGATWTACSPCCRLGLSLTSPTRPEKLPSTKVRSRASRIMSSARTELLYWPHLAHLRHRIITFGEDHSPTINPSPTYH